MCWIDVYLGPPNIIIHDKEESFMRGAIQANTEMLQICTRYVPIECANHMTVIDRHHAAIRRVFSTITMEILNMEKDETI